MVKEQSGGAAAGAVDTRAIDKRPASGKTADGKAGAGQCVFDEASDVSGDDCRVRIFV